MNKIVKRLFSTTLVFAMLLGTIPAFAAYQPGTYDGSGTGFLGEIKVEVVIDEAGIIASVEVTENSDTASFWNRAYPEMANRIVAALSTEVDTVSGATYSSLGIIEAVNDALAKAGEPDPGSPDRAALDELIAQVDALDFDLYTYTTWSAVSTPLNNARTVSANAEATESEIAAAYEALKSAVDALVVYEPGDKYAYTLEELQAYAADMKDGETLYIEADIDAVSSATISTYANFTIDGQNHTLNGNDAHGFVYVRGGELTLKNVTIENAAQLRGANAINGSAVYARRGDAIIENCTFIGNRSSNGAVWVANGYNLKVVNSTFMDNEANNGAAIYVNNGATAELANNIMIESDNSDLWIGETATVTDGGYNLVASYSGPGGVLGETTTVDETLNNHSSWINHSAELVESEDSPARNRIPADNPYLPSTDRRGVSRPQGALGDIGSFELEIISDAEGVSIDSSALTTMSKSKTLQLTATVTPADASITWTSSNTAVATIDENGLITPVKAGTTVITASTANGLTSKITLRVTN